MIAIYARVSDDKLKTDGDRRQDIDRQIQDIRDWLSKGEWNEEIVVFADDGKSAFKDDYSNRPEFCRLIREIRARRISRVFVEDLTRWSRRVEDGLRTMNEAAKNSCTITSIAEGEIDTTLPDGWFKCAIGLLIAEYASRVMAWKIKSGMARAKTEGKNIGRPKKGREDKGEVDVLVSETSENPTQKNTIEQG